MSFKRNLLVASNRAASRLWSMCLRRGIIAFDDEELLRTITDGVPWNEYWKSFTSEFAGRFFYSPRNQKDFFLQTLLSLHPYEEILDDANDAASRTVDIFGSGPTTLPSPVAWNVDFRNGSTWEDAWYDAIKPSHAAYGGDIKAPWELGRMQFLPWLGKGYWASNSRKYVDSFREWITSWCDANPMGRGVQWSNAMEVSIRSCNWIAGMAFFLEAATLDEHFWQRMLVTLWRHGEFIENNLEITRRSGNHLIANYTGLAFLGALFGHTGAGERWFAEGVRGVEREIMRQTLPDGVDYEKSIPYHRFVAEMGMSVMLLCRHLRSPFRNDVAARLENMCEFAMHYTRADGSVPNIGDNDNGRLFRFRNPENILDHTVLLSTASIAFHRADFKSAAGKFSEESLWLTGTAGWERFMALDSLDNRESQAFPDGGFYVLRTSTLHCIVDAGELGKQGWGGHGHNDTLSFELWRGQPVIVDSGTFCYTSDLDARNKFRSTAAHNTAMVDSVEIAEFDGVFKIKEDLTNPIVTKWETTPDRDILVAQHSAYTRLSDPVVHSRTFTLDKKNDTLLVRDEFLCTGKHMVDLPFHFSAGLELEQRTDSMVAFSGAATKGTITSSHALKIEDCWLSPSFGTKIKSRKVVCRSEISGNTTVEVSILFV